MEPLEDLFETVIEPDHSKQILLEYQKKYGMNSIIMWFKYTSGQSLNISSKELDRWLFEYEMYRAAEGDIRELI